MTVLIARVTSAVAYNGSLNVLSQFRNIPNMSFLKAIGQGLTGAFLEKPKYEVVTKEDGYEERKYGRAKWVSTTVENISQKQAGSTGFSRLFKYITGDNEKEIKIDMTAPVATRIVPGAGPNCDSTFTISFYIPPKHQDDPPKPKSSDVFIEDFPEMTIYASGFGGFANDEQWINEARQLSEKLKDKDIHTEFYFTAGYDSPFKLFNRLNEEEIETNDRLSSILSLINPPKRIQQSHKM